jgi:D-glycero-alpha-D-manno-heptose-7-phosphate kinase
MIIGRSPLRITLGGGSSDLASYYSLHGGFLIAAAIDQYVYVTINHTTFDEILLRYSQRERVKKIEDINHPIIREALKLTNINDINIEITSMADQPSGTGLGSGDEITLREYAYDINFKTAASTLIFTVPDGYMLRG